MLTIEEAFRKFKSRLELTEREQKDASRRQQEIRGHMDSSFDIANDFLTGSYKRWTKTKPLKDVDIFCVLGEKERQRRSEGPSKLLQAVEKALIGKYGNGNVRCQRRSVTVDFGVAVHDDESDEQVVSFDVVPAFVKDDYFEIPDTSSTGGWTKTNPKVHADKATQAHQNYANEWKGIVRMAKYWNNNSGKPIKPSFLLEVMCLEVLHPPFGNKFDYEFQALFATLANRISDTWKDPAGLGPDVSDMMNDQAKASAKTSLESAQRQATEAIRLSRVGQNGDALKAWRKLFGPLFPLS